MAHSFSNKLTNISVFQKENLGNVGFARNFNIYFSLVYFHLSAFSVPVKESNLDKMLGKLSFTSCFAQYRSAG